jgi:hypothetical protein
MSENQKITEFNNNVWNHSEDTFQLTFDDRRSLSQHELTFLNKIYLMISDKESEDEILKFLRETFLADSFRSLELLLQIIGMTRTKMVTDLRGIVGADKSGYKLSKHTAVVRHEKTWGLAGPYLLKKIKKVFVVNVKIDSINRMYEALNQATWPGYIRQERAKRMGHEAESRMAILLASLNIPFVPFEKADNPLCRDVQINKISFDIVIPDIKNPKICVKSTTHTSNIGQFGESKDHLEVDEARRMVDESYDKLNRPIIFAFIDGVGLQTNRAGLEGVLEKSDEFCQFKTIWKLMIAALYYTNKKCDLFLDQNCRDNHTEFLERYNSCFTIKGEDEIDVNSLEAGEAKIFLID